MAMLQASASSANNKILRLNGSGKIASGIMGAMIDALQALAGDITDKLIYGNGTSSLTTADTKSYGRSLLNLANQGELQTAVGAAAAPVLNTQTNDYTVLTSDQDKIINETGTAKIVTLDAAATLGSNFCTTIKAGAAAVTLKTTGSETLDGVNIGTIGLTISPYESMSVICTGSAYLAF